MQRGVRAGREEGGKIGLEKGGKKGMDRVFEVYGLFQKKHTEDQIAEETGLSLQEVQEILVRLNQ